MKIETLKRPAEFKRVRGGPRWATPLFVVEGRRRPEADSSQLRVPVGARFGFTITRKVGGAVVRNRIRRRLREALRTLDSAPIRPEFDYVVVASRAMHDYPFAGLQNALREAFERLYSQGESGSGKGRRKPASSPKGEAEAGRQPERSEAGGRASGEAAHLQPATAPDTAITKGQPGSQPRRPAR